MYTMYNGLLAVTVTVTVSLLRYIYTYIYTSPCSFCLLQLSKTVLSVSSALLTMYKSSVICV